MYDSTIFFTYFGFNLSANRRQTSGCLVGEECFGGGVCHIQTGLEIAAVTLHWTITTTAVTFSSAESEVFASASFSSYMATKALWQFTLFRLQTVTAGKST